MKNTNTNSFIDNLHETIADNTFVETENGALGYKSTGHELLDFFYKIPSYRDADVQDVFRDFDFALRADPVYAIRLLFLARDIRGGMGERKLFRNVFYHLFSGSEPWKYVKYLDLFPEYGRWDDLVDVVFMLHDNKIANACGVVDVGINIIRKQLIRDLMNTAGGNGVSLLAKWLPSENASSRETVKKARFIRRKLEFSPKAYRKALSELRKSINIVERDISANDWGKVNYEHVPSKANLKYKCAFLRHDNDRRTEFLKSLENGEAKINSGAVYPYEIVYKYTRDEIDPALEGMWKNLRIPDKIKDGKMIVVADSSWSMYAPLSDGSSGRVIDVAFSLAILTADNLAAPYKGKWITFSGYPQFVDMSNCNNLLEKIKLCYSMSEMANTNIEKVMDLILKTAIDNNVKSGEIPDVMIVSDMEFDVGVDGRFDAPLFKNIEKKYSDRGYAMPKIVFWNVASRTNAIPLTKSDSGVVLLSGFSQHIMDMVVGDEFDPYAVLKKKLDSPRYAVIN